ncbi:PEP-CTERM/exosortase system-associated acyltransferase [Psychrosphaera ytuae]|uniref:PEP-CTERM/exosortase system-associated acyltransferase n=1 Tax=Psychrosphaera ytuae TaxID=2820710 RepID=A0A975HJD7_9GAMM|nr:PEP-CTERM/exosortase system-associated acyltransferase [Psychrosphaera ytuae]QTH63104.1 PEP-CTERM/exosortase system-associated acyltransferase [Psychrosphaera ytuae]
MSFLKKLSSKPVIGPIAERVGKVVVNHKANQIARHFAQFLKPVVAYNSFLRDEAFKIRHNVYCEELAFEECREDKRETDEADAHSIICLIQHRSTQKYAGTCRVVYSRSEEQLLPLERYCSEFIDDPELHPSKFARNKICEISRLAVPASFRRRASDKHKGAATGAINENTYSESELRCFPFIAVGLYLCAASVVISKEIDHCYVMMEPRLARSLSFLGIKFKQIGPVVDYHGRRAPYYISPEMLLNSLTPGFKRLFSSIKGELENEVFEDESGLVVISSID